MRLVICAGHNETHYGVKKNGHVEYEEVLRIAKVLFEILGPIHDCHFVEGTLAEKVNKINAIKPNLALEIHLGNINNDTTRGCRGLYSSYHAEGKLAADLIINSLTKELECDSLGTEVGWYKHISPEIVKSGRCPEGWKPKLDLFLGKSNYTSVIVEPYFISSLDDCLKYTNPNMIDVIAQGLASGILSYFNHIHTDRSRFIKKGDK